MRILFVNQYYWPDYAATSQMMADLAEHLAQRGHDVHVLCSRGKYDDGSGVVRTLPGHERHAGVHIHRLRATGFGKRSAMGRAVDYLTFHLLIGLRLLLVGWRYDLIVTLTTPPLVGVYATPIRTFSRVRHVCWVMDLHPDCEFALGLLSRRNPLAGLADWLNGLHFRRAHACVVLGRHMGQRLIEKGVRHDRVHVVPVWGHAAPPPGMTPQDDGRIGALRRELGLAGKFVAMYSGNAGLVHTFDTICAAALKLRDDDRFVFLFVGGGRRIREIEAFKNRHQLANIRLLPYFPREQLDISLAMGDVHLISLRDGMAGLAVPSKLYGIMAAGRPVIFVGPESCDTADAIRTANCGLTVPATDMPGFLAALAQLAANADLRNHLAANARAAYDRDARPEIGCGRWTDLLESVAEFRKPDDAPPPPRA